MRFFANRLKHDKNLNINKLFFMENCAKLVFLCCAYKNSMTTTTKLKTFNYFSSLVQANNKVINLTANKSSKNDFVVGIFNLIKNDIKNRFLITKKKAVRVLNLISGLNEATKNDT